MSELTKEDIDPLQKCLQWLKDNPESPIEDCMSIADVAGYFEELLSLRSLRDVGDEEVVRLAEEYQLGETEFHRIQTYKKLEGFAITRGQQLREARAEIERFKGNTENLILKLNGDLATITAERDEARRDVEKWVTTVGNASRLVDSLTAELAAIKAAPGMEEVDAILQDTEKSSEQIESDLADLARRSIASREEVVGKLTDTERLIKWMVKHWDWTGKLESIAEGCVIEPWKENARLVLEIAEGK